MNYMNKFICVHMFICVYVQMRIISYACMFICVRVLYVYIHIHSYVHIRVFSYMSTRNKPRVNMLGGEKRTQDCYVHAMFIFLQENNIMLKYTRCRRQRKIWTGKTETDVTRHNRGLSEGPHKPLNTIVRYDDPMGFREAPNEDPMIPRDLIHLDNSTYDCCCFSSLHKHQ